MAYGGRGGMEFPLLLAGPILRRLEPACASVWLACATGSPGAATELDAIGGPA